MSTAADTRLRPAQRKLSADHATNRKPIARMIDKIRATIPIEQTEPPILIPETPLVNFLSQLTKTQRLGIHNIRLNEDLGYGCDRTFRNAEALYRWLTPNRIITCGRWPAEMCRKQWFRIDLTADHVLQYAESVENPESLSGIVGRSNH